MKFSTIFSRPGAVWALTGLLFWTLLLGATSPVKASHLRAGDIQSKVDTTAGANPRRIFFRLTIYRDRSSTVPQSLAETNIYFGDGTSALNGAGMRRSIASGISTSDTEVIYFDFEHIYPAASSYLVSFIGQNRNTGIVNMTTSDQQSFYISTRVTIDPALLGNHSPVLLAPAYDKAGLRQVFLHNPAAYDADGDSLTFELRPCQQVPGGVAGVQSNTPTPQVCNGYVYPDDRGRFPNARQVPYAGPPVGVPGANAVFVQDPQTGQIVWNAPDPAGIYNVAFVVHEWRRGAFGPRLIGEITRDMQIIVVPTNNQRPTIAVPPDICVVAGQAVSGVVTAVDGTGNPADGATAITLFAYGGILPPATFTQTQMGPPQARATFRWNTTCADVSATPYQVLFKAQDNPPQSSPPLASDPPPLIDQRTWRITVVGPPPQNLQAVRNATNQVALSWNPYTCINASRIYIYRRENPSGFVPGPCDTGIPASAGYTLLTSVAATAISYLDTGGAAGLGRGKTYCYRIYAEFPRPKGGESIASEEACVTFPGLAALLKNVDVDRTSATGGQITVRWTPARTGNGPALPGPLGYRVYRGLGLIPSSYTLVHTYTLLSDSVHIDTGLNTQNLQYTYRLEFFYATSTQPGAGEVVEQVGPASSVFTSTVPDGINGTVTVSWTYQVPWDNAAQPVQIFRKVGTAAIFTPVATAPTGASGGTYLDNDPTLQKGETYCYYVQTTGRYRPTGHLSALVNKSQEHCTLLAEVPCTPVLTLQPANCDSLAALPNFPAQLPNIQKYSNALHWTGATRPAGCQTAVRYYRIFYRATESGPLVLLDSTTQTSYVHRELLSSTGCYAVQAVSSLGVRSALSNIACQDICVFFTLPNIFTPNADGKNDSFRPKNYSPLRSVHFKAFNRWGVKVFENTTTAETFINWDGNAPASEAGSSATVSGGVYYYLAEVEFADASHTIRTYKGWVEVIR